MVKIGDVAVEEEKIVETPKISSPENKEKKEKQASSTKKSKDKKQSRGFGRVKITKQSKKNEISSFKENIYIVFVECETPGNIGFLARTMANFGLKNLILINPPKLTNETYYQTAPFATRSSTTFRLEKTSTRYFVFCFPCIDFIIFKT